MRSFRSSLATGLVFAAIATASCMVVPVTPNTTNRAPIISALDYSPKSAVGKNDLITFTVVANDLEGDALQYNWSSTKGLLTSNTGMVAAWKPSKADGSFEPGLTTVSVIISDGRQTTTGSVNLMIDAAGGATVSQTLLPSPEPVAAASSAPAASPSPADNGQVPGKILFEDGFESGLDAWNRGSRYLDMNGSNRWNPLGWKTVLSGAQAGKFAAVLNDNNDTVKEGTAQPDIWIFSKKTLDLTTAVMPRVRMYFKSGASPSTSVAFKMFWIPPTTDGIYNHNYVGGTVNVSSSAGWVMKDFELTEMKGKEGHIGVMLEVEKPTNEFQGPMVDSITVYDAAQ